MVPTELDPGTNLPHSRHSPPSAVHGSIINKDMHIDEDMEKCRALETAYRRKLQGWLEVRHELDIAV